MTWADVAHHHICLVTSSDLSKDLVHEDFTHIQEKVADAMLDEVPEDQMMKLGTSKSGLKVGVSWYHQIIPKVVSRTEGSPGYRFYGPGELSFRTYKLIVTDKKCGENPE